MMLWIPIGYWCFYPLQYTLSIGIGCSIQSHSGKVYSVGGCQVDQNTTKSMFLSKVLSATASRSTTALRFHSTATGSTSPFLKDFITSEDKGPVETAIESKVGGWVVGLVAMQVVNTLIKLIEALDPSTLHIVNESHMHAHHAAMKGNTNKETHFRWVTLCVLTSPISHLHCCSITLISEKFAGQVKKKKGELRKRKGWLTWNAVIDFDATPSIGLQVTQGWTRTRRACSYFENKDTKRDWKEINYYDIHLFFYSSLSTLLM